MVAANGIEDGDIKAVRAAVKDYPESHEIVERVVIVSAKYR